MKRAQRGRRLTPATSATSAVVDDAVVVYCERTERIHCLDLPASFVWALCDGTRDLAAVAEETARAVGRDTQEVSADVEATVAQFQALGILQ